MRSGSQCQIRIPGIVKMDLIADPRIQAQIRMEFFSDNDRMELWFIVYIKSIWAVLSRQRNISSIDKCQRPVYSAIVQVFIDCTHSDMKAMVRKAAKFFFLSGKSCGVA